ncbi:MAG: hypothetical protein Ct9H90mP9_0970 [Pseudomonadota bacterium]|nr:MAG: hypothetical protein Ct9H90mP9_0970 [Pseudomonadota bacterium]
MSFPVMLFFPSLPSNNFQTEARYGGLQQAAELNQGWVGVTCGAEGTSWLEEDNYATNRLSCQTVDTLGPAMFSMALRSRAGKRAFLKKFPLVRALLLRHKLFQNRGRDAIPLKQKLKHFSRKGHEPIEPLKISVLPLHARPLSPFPEETCRNAWNLLEQIPPEWSGSKELLFEQERLKAGLKKWSKTPDLLLVLQFPSPMRP